MTAPRPLYPLQCRCSMIPVIPRTWYPEPLTPAEIAAAVVATDVAGQVEAVTWPDSWLTEAERRMWR